MIKDYYKARGVPTYGIKFDIDKTMDDYGSALYTIRSNIKFDIAKGTMELN